MHSVCYISEFGARHVMAVNSENEGLFFRKELDGAYTQLRGTMQYRCASKRGFIQSLIKRGVIPNRESIVYTAGWPEDNGWLVYVNREVAA